MGTAFPITTDAKMTVATADWSITGDTTDPGSMGTFRVLLDGVSAAWATDVLPPVAQPSTVSFSIYQSGPDPFGNWLPLDLGTPISVFAYVGDAGSWRELLSFKGRVQDIAATNHKAGGIVFSIVCVDRLADLGSQLAPALLSGVPAGFPTAYDLLNVYIQLRDDAGIDFDYATGATTAVPFWADLLDVMDLTNVSTLDALSRFIVHDWRGPGLGRLIGRWLTQQLDVGTTDPELVARYKLNEYDPTQLDDLAGAVAFHWTGASWQLLTNADYYDAPTNGEGIVLTAAQLALDVGEWRKTRDQAINQVELQGTFVGGAGTVETVRRKFADLVALYGPNTRQVECYWKSIDDARAFGDTLLGARDQLQIDGYGFTQATVAFEQLDSDQLQTWASQLWPRFGVAPMGRPFAITDVPDHWRLTAGKVIVGRLLGVELQLAAGKVRAQLTTRAVPSSAVNGITPNDIAGFPVVMTPNNIDPAATVDDLAIAGPTPI